MNIQTGLTSPQFNNKIKQTVPASNLNLESETKKIENPFAFEQMSFGGKFELFNHCSLDDIDHRWR